MIKLLTEKEHIVDAGEIKIVNGRLEVENAETRGTIKQCAIDNFSMEDHVQLTWAIKLFGLQDYICFERDGETTYIRVIVEEE